MKKARYFIVLIMVIVLLLLASSSAFADDTNLGRMPDGVFPIAEHDIAMQSEDIVVDLDKNKVHCAFTFHNTGAGKDVLMGFPGKLRDLEEDQSSEYADITIDNFKAYLKGKSITVKHERSSSKNDLLSSETLKYSEYYTFPVSFKEGETLTVENTYDFYPTYDSMGYIYSGYVLKTGAMWKDTIGKARVTFKLGKIKPYNLEELKWGGFRFEGDDLVWERSNFEPEYDLRVVYNTWKYSKEFEGVDYVEDDMKNDIKKKISLYNNVKRLGESKDVDGLCSLYKTAVQQRDCILAKYIESFFPSDFDTTRLYKPQSTGVFVEKQDNGYIIESGSNEIESACVHFKIVTTDNQQTVFDENIDGTALYFQLNSETEYDIGCSVTDWQGNIDYRSLTYSTLTKTVENGELPANGGATAIASTDVSSQADANSSDTAVVNSESTSKSESKDISSTQNSGDGTKSVVTIPLDKPFSNKVIIAIVVIIFVCIAFIVSAVVYALLNKRNKRK